MRIAEVTATFPPYHGGTGNVCLANALELARAGHDVHVFTGRRGPGFGTDPPGITVHRLPPLFRVGNAPCLPQLANELRGFDVVHLHYPFIFGAEWVLLAAARSKSTLVTTYHQDLNFKGLLRVGQLVYESMVKQRVLRRSKIVIVPTLDYAAHSSLRATLAKEPKKFVEIPNSVDFSRFSPGPPNRELRDSLGIGDEPVVLFVGGLDKPHKFKGIEVLLSAFKLVDSLATLLIVGDGDLRQGYEALAAKSGLGTRVRFAGRVEDCDLPDYYRLARVVILPSTTTEEIFGIVLVESLATGVPVIASDLPGVRTLIDSAETGLLAPACDPTSLASAVDRLLAASHLYTQTEGERRRERAEKKYSRESTGAKLLSVLEEATR